ncbi:phenylalanine--tRNA ligase beta subunit-related protein [Haliangium sp.]|uniref:phenylalanine--tRNA ligase beta subunit-related protein n=1 Tax=Haliangium sp. TaxID=2663208 RepID=UPI003D0BB837
MLTVAPHPLLELAAFTSVFPAPLGRLPAASALVALLAPGATTPFSDDPPGDALRKAVRDLLRSPRFKPTGRSKPASEYLVKAAAEGRLGSINPAVDAGNAVSLHSGLPVSVVDLDRAQLPLTVALAGDDASYVFNPAGQVISVGGLLGLADAEGPCANAVKDAQRTKTGPDTTRTLSLIWGTSAAPGRAARAAAWYRELLASLGATTADVPGVAAAEGP